MDEQLDRLARDLDRHGPGPVDDLLNQAVSQVMGAAQSFAAWLRQSAEDRPLMTMLVLGQAGYFAGLLRRRYVRRWSRR